jgi:hypothetical protein
MGENMLMRFNMKMRWPEMGLIEFLWKLVATVVVFGIIGILTADHAESGSALQGFSYFVVGSCALVGVVSTITAVILHIWRYKPRSRRRCLSQNSN